jgi:hypothetical protein
MSTREVGLIPVTSDAPGTRAWTAEVLTVLGAGAEARDEAIAILRGAR